MSKDDWDFNALNKRLHSRLRSEWGYLDTIPRKMKGGRTGYKIISDMALAEASVCSFLVDRDVLERKDRFLAELRKMLNGGPRPEDYLQDPHDTDQANMFWRRVVERLIDEYE